MESIDDILVCFTRVRMFTFNNYIIICIIIIYNNDRCAGKHKFHKFLALGHRNIQISTLFPFCKLGVISRWIEYIMLTISFMGKLP